MPATRGSREERVQLEGLHNGSLHVAGIPARTLHVAFTQAEHRFLQHCQNGGEGDKDAQQHAVRRVENVGYREIYTKDLGREYYKISQASQSSQGVAFR